MAKKISVIIKIILLILVLVLFGMNVYFQTKLIRSSIMLNRIERDFEQLNNDYEELHKQVENEIGE